jgi:formiminotetrahydrofolate cyclodeaminase
MLSSFLEDLAEPRPDPGGGAAAAYGVSLGLALATKIARLEAGRERGPSSRDGRREEIVAALAALRTEASRLQDEDCRAYRKLVEASAPGHERLQFLAAFEEAVRCPIRIAKTAGAGLVLIAEIGSYCKRYLIPDLQVAAEFLGAAGEGAYCIAAANFILADSPTGHELLRAELDAVLLQGRVRLASARDKLQGV